MDTLREQFEYQSRILLGDTERYVQVHVKKKPSWMPKRVHRWLLSRILILAEFKVMGETKDFNL